MDEKTRGAVEALERIQRKACVHALDAAAPEGAVCASNECEACRDVAHIMRMLKPQVPPSIQPAAPESQKSKPTLWALAMEAAAGLRSMLATDGLFSDADWRGKVKCLLNGLDSPWPVPRKGMADAIVQDADRVRAAITGMLGAEATEAALSAYGRLVSAAAQMPFLLEMLAEACRARDDALSSEIALRERVAALQEHAALAKAQDIVRLHEVEAERDAYRKGLVSVAEIASQGGAGEPPSTPEYQEAMAAVGRLWNTRAELQRRVDAFESSSIRVIDLERELAEETERHQRWEERATGEYETALAEEKEHVTRLKHALKQTARVWDATGGHCWCVHREVGETVKEHDARCAELRAVLGEGAQAVAPVTPARLSEEVMRPWSRLLTGITKPRPPRHWVDFALAALPEAMREVCSGRVVTAPGEEVQATVARVAGDVADAMMAHLEAAARREAEADKAQSAALHEAILSPKQP